MTIKSLAEAPSIINEKVSNIRDKIFAIRRKVSPVENAKVVNPSDFDELKEVLRESLGDVYKYYYDQEFSWDDPGMREWQDPNGNNILLHIVSVCCHLQHLPQEERIQIKNLTQDLISFVIEDAKSKLTPEEFSEFINFESRRSEEYYKNTPLTLAVSSGLIDSANLIINNGALVDVKDGFGFSPLSISIMRQSHLEGEAAEKNMSLNFNLVEHGAHCDSKILPNNLVRPKTYSKVFKVTNLSMEGFEKGKFYSLEDIIAKKELFKDIQSQLATGSYSIPERLRSEFVKFDFDKSSYSYKDILDFGSWISMIRNSSGNQLFSVNIHDENITGPVSRILHYDAEFNIDIATMKSYSEFIYNDEWNISHSEEFEILCAMGESSLEISDHK